MAKEDAAVQNFIVYKLGSIFAIIGVLWYFRRSVKYHTQQRIFAWIMNRITKRINRGFYKDKTKIFELVHDYKADVNKDISILEVGAGTAANLQHFPPNSKFTCLDPNPHFVGYIKDNLQKCDTVVSAEIVHGFAENMPLQDDKFDVIVCTLVLCCVSSVEESLAEIKRVLKPGGLFVFLEHVAAEKNTWTWLLQGIANPFHNFFGDGCNTQRDTGTLIKNAGFKHLNLESYRAKNMPIWLKPCILGSARK